MSALELLEQAVLAAREAGVECHGFTLQSSPQGYAAWVYVEDDEGQWPLIEEVECQNTAIEAARWALETVRGAR